MNSLSTLFSPVAFAGLNATHLVVLAPMTRARSRQTGDIPNALNAQYYAQRASAALIVTEATQIKAIHSHLASTVTLRCKAGKV